MPPIKRLSRRVMVQLGALENDLRAVVTQRNTALRLFLVSRGAATAVAQREFWLEFFRLDQEYRAAVHKLAQFCSKHRRARSARASLESGRADTGSSPFRPGSLR